VIQWNETDKVFVDYMGYPVSRSEVIAMRDNIRLHLKRSAADLAELANVKMRVDMPKHPPLSPEGFQ
jgi:hypothetical protein